MKPTTLLLAVSLLANLGLVAYVGLRPASSAAPSITSPGKPSPASDGQEHALRTALASGDAGALEAAGVPPDLARQIVLGRTFAQLADRIRAIQARAPSDERWWRNRGNQPGARESQLLARREISDALVAAFGDDFGLGGGDSGQYAFLPAAKRDALRRIQQDYDEMFAKFGAGGVQLPSDRERLRLLRAERDRDIAALLSPEERLAYEMRTSPSAAVVRARYGDAIETEAEFRRIFELQKAFDEKFPRDALTGRISPETMRARAEGERQLDHDIRAAVGDERYAALRRASDPDLRMLDSIAGRLNLPASAADRVVASRERYAAESQRVMNDNSIPMPQRRTQIQELGTRATSELAQTLGAEAAEAYAQRSPWVNMLQGGTAFATAPQPGSPAILGGGAGVFPVLPAGVVGAGTTRQVIVNATPAFDAPIGSDRLVAQPANVQVMSFTTTTGTSDPATAPAPAAGQHGALVTPEGLPPPTRPAPQPRPPR